MNVSMTVPVEKMTSSEMRFVFPDAKSSGVNVSFDVIPQSNQLSTPVQDSESSERTFNAPFAEKWNAESNARFKELARAEAIRDLSVEELAELNALTRLRQAEKYPRSADEILWQRRQHNVTRNLVHALTTYVKFHETPRSS
jgi:hypothetical protein